MNILRFWILRIGLFLCVSVIFVPLSGCGTRLQQATPNLIQEAEAKWKKEAIPNYKIVVDVQMQGDMRRNEITVKNNDVQEATVSYEDHGKWVRTRKLNESQAYAFTVRGLFQTVEEELEVHSRSYIRVALNPDKAFIERVVLGQVLQKNAPIARSQVYIFVRKFEPLT